MIHLAMVTLKNKKQVVKLGVIKKLIHLAMAHLKKLKVSSRELAFRKGIKCRVVKIDPLGHCHI